ncbi:hypothetical protein [Qipengyuania spongiae]|uniref:Lipoprotein n=1 Tax=Qipengyuania spongiae TaxID=2909673 RepID=A0ABY5SXM7_9SPHN|nr:hypothetical protein [Qipengyuania spongiae]UVI39298.1 hypothetical protein L1F33_13895 [Qipengyuania spongiae]
MTKIFRLIPALSLTMVAAACSDPGTNDAETAPVETAIPVEPDGGIGDGAGPPVASRDTIPASFRGVWDIADGTCNPASDLRMDIRDDEIEFYESLGKVMSVEVENPDTIVVSLAMSGEGETWNVASRYVLSEGGAVLTPFETETNPQYQPIPRKRCS